MKNFLFPSIAFLILILTGCGNQQDQTVDLLLLNASVVDISSGTVQENLGIAIKGDTIIDVMDMDQGRSFRAKDTVDLKNNFVIPGLWDMHVHFRGGDTLVQENKELLPLFLDHGVTTVRDAGGDIAIEVLKWRDQIQSGKMNGPRIFTSGPKLDGKNPAWAGSIKVADIKEIPGVLDSLETLNVDYVKMYDGSLTKEVFYGIIQEAEIRGLKTTGHMPLSADIVEAAQLGLDGTEHLYYILKSCSPLSDSLSAENPGYGMMTKIIESYDPELAREVFRDMHDKEVYITPTLHIGKTLSEILEVDHSQDSLLSQIGTGIIKTYQGRINSAKRAESSGSTLREDMERKSREMIRPMFEEGVPLLAGSDCGPFNSYVYPGQSLIEELERLTEAGLTPREALSTSVINGPAFFDLQDRYGSVEPGKSSDLLVLKKNPLEHIENLREIEAVIQKGQIVR